MTKRVLIIGGYGNFGGIIATMLAPDTNIKLLIGGRSLDKAKKFIAGLKAAVAPEPIEIDMTDGLAAKLSEVAPDIVIHTTGPFQFQGYGVAEACIRQGCHYIDLADARDFVAGIGRHDAAAKEANVLVVSGASSVPCLTAAIIDQYRSHFSVLDTVEYGITAAQQTNRGLATVSAVLSYVGEPFFTQINGQDKKIYGWQGLHAHRYPQLGLRLFGNCDVPDLELFPPRYPDLRTIRFSGGLEVASLHMGLWLLSWPARVRLIPPLEYLAPALLKMSRMFDALGRKRSGFHMLMSGVGKDGKPRAEAFYIIARSGHGIHIPCVPSVLLVKRIASGALNEVGARPCLDLIDLDSYCDALKGLDISILKDVKVAQPKAKKKPKAKPAATPSRTAVEAFAESEEAYSYKKNSSVPAFPEDKPLFIFDGVCILCSSGVAWIMKSKHTDKFRFASAQSPLGQALYRHYGLDFDDTYLLIDKGVAYTKSDGYLHMTGTLGGLWLYLKLLDLIPRGARDWAYDVVARNRYKWFGKARSQCELIPDRFKKNMLK